MATLQFDPIQLDGIDEKNIQKLNSWIIRLIENLSYVLNNIETDNMTSETEKTFSQIQETAKTAKEAKEIVDKLMQQIDSGELQGPMGPPGVSTLLNYIATRPASADKSSTSDRIGAVEAFVASSKMTTGKPGGDAKILQMNWDNVSGWDSQLAMLNNGTLQHRAMSSGTWGTWKTLLDSSNYTKYTAEYEKGTWTPRLFNTASNEITTAIAAKGGNYYRLGDIVFIEAMILTTSSYACHHVSGLPYEPDHGRPSNVYPIGIVSSGNGTNSPFNQISGSGSYYVQNGAYASGKTYESWYVYGWYRKA